MRLLVIRLLCWVVGHYAQSYCSLGSDTRHSGEVIGGKVAVYWLLKVRKYENSLLRNSFNVNVYVITIKMCEFVSIYVIT